MRTVWLVCVAALTVTLLGAGRPILTGRNCGGTSLIGLPAPAAQPAPGGASWATPADFSGGRFAGVEISGGRLTLARTGWANEGAVDLGAETQRQLSPSIILQPDGSRLLIWQESTPRDGGDILFAVEGAESGLQAEREAVRVDDTGLGSSVQSAPTIARTADGTLHAAWSDLRQGRGYTDIYYAFSTDGGATWSPNAVVSSITGAVNHTQPQLMATPDGNLVLVWRMVSTIERIMFSRSSAGSWSTPASVHVPLRSGKRANPALALAADGTLLAAWDDTRTGSPKIYVARLAPGATSWAGGLLASDTASAIHPSMAIGTGGTVYLAWSNGFEIRVARSADGGATWGASVRVDNSDSSKTFPRLAVDSKGGVHCIWCQLLGSADIAAARSADGGATWGERAIIAPGQGTSTPPALVADGAGNVFAAWGNGDDNAEEVFTARWPRADSYLNSGSYTSRPHDTGRSGGFRFATWAAALPTGAALSIAMRSGNSPTPDATWSPWRTYTESPAALGTLPAGRYVQWRANLTAGAGGRPPSLDRLTIIWDGALYLPLLRR